MSKFVFESLALSFFRIHFALWFFFFFLLLFFGPRKTHTQEQQQQKHSFITLGSIYFLFCSSSSFYCQAACVCSAFCFLFTCLFVYLHMDLFFSCNVFFGCLSAVGIAELKRSKKCAIRSNISI